MEQLQAGGYTVADREIALTVALPPLTRDTGPLKNLVNTYQTLWQDLENDLALSPDVYVKDSPATDVPLAQWRTLFSSWKDSLDLLPDWVAWQHELQKGKASLVAPLVALIEQGKIPAAQVMASFQRIVSQQQLGHFFQQDTELATFNGTLHNEKVAQFQRADRQRLDLAKINVLTVYSG